MRGIRKREEKNGLQVFWGVNGMMELLSTEKGKIVVEQICMGRD